MARATGKLATAKAKGVSSRFTQQASRAKEIAQADFDVVAFFTVDGVAGDHDDLEVVLELVLVEPVSFADQAAGTVAGNGIADFAARHNSNHARLVRRRQHMGDSQAAVIPAPVVVHALKLAGTQQVLTFRK